MSNTAAHLPWSLRLGWGVGSLGASTLLNAVTFFAQFWLTQVLGIAPALAGVLIFGARLYDIVTDPVMGIASDRASFRAGRRRPFLAAAALPAALAFVMLFNVPALGAGATIAWVLAALLLYATAYTVFSIPYLAMAAEMTADYHERARLMSVRVVFVSLGILLANSLGPVLVGAFGGDRAAWGQMSVVLAAIIAASMLLCYAATRGATQTPRVASTAPISAQLRSALGNRPFVVLIGSKLLHLAGVSVSITSLLFVITQVLERPESAAGPFVLASVCGTMLSMPLWTRATARFGKRDTYIGAVLLYLPVLATWLASGPGEPDWLLWLRGLAIGVVTGGLTLTAQAMLPDTIAHDHDRTGLRREGSFTAVYSFVEKLAAATGPLIFGLVLQFAGYPAGGDAPSLARAILWSAALLPAAASLLSALVLLAYRLDASLRVEAAA